MDIATGFFAVLCLLGGVLAWIDIRHGIIPNELNLTIAALGLAKAVLLGGWHAGLLAVVTGVAIGVIVWLFRRLYYALRRVQGLGLGDVKFLAAAGTWISVFELPMLLLVASLVALIAIGVLRLTGRSMTRQTMIPFGPFLALGLLVTVALQLWPR
ncbi:A24 family peptidase [Bradyrhizobium prioriisuperbiae]|uniref:A24 family peptidase n=1 Tax=Bradyrhizobium prioriisuperbiae TaxID=2854389 RepID=UPI0028E894C0|nr:A24 family peptidase [Bradyrhizobium prioritasuperba]